MAREGVRFLMRKLIAVDPPRSPNDMASVWAAFEKQADDIHRNSSALNHLDLDTPEGAAGAARLCEERNGSQEWWALILGGAAQGARHAVERGETAVAAQMAHLAAIAHSMLVVTDEHLDNAVWLGYLAAKRIHDTADATSREPAETAQIRHVEGLLARQPEAVLFAWADSGEPIGQRIGVRDMSEPVLRSLAKYQLEAKARERERAKERRESRIKWAGVFVGGLGTGATLFGLLLKVLGKW